MLVNATEMLINARDGHYGVPQFTINNLAWTKSVLTACEEMKSPVLLGVSGFWSLRPLIIALSCAISVSYTHLLFLDALHRYTVQMGAQLLCRLRRGRVDGKAKPGCEAVQPQDARCV